MSRLVIYEQEGTVEELIYQLIAHDASALVLSILPQQEVTRVYKDKEYVVVVSQAVLRFNDYQTYEHYAPRLNLPELTSREYYK